MEDKSPKISWNRVLRFFRPCRYTCNLIKDSGRVCGSTNTQVIEPHSGSGVDFYRK